MKKHVIYALLIALFPGFSSSYAEQATLPGPTAFNPSDFQTNASSIINLELDAQSYLQNKEIDDLNFSLHLINHDGTQLQNPQQQFIADYSRNFCNPNYESNIPECNQDNKNNLVRVYANLRPSNIFDLQYTDTDSALAKGIVQTLIEPFPNNQLNTILSDPQAVKNSDKQNTMANLIAPQAALMLAKNSLNEIMARRYPHDSNANSKSIMQMIHDESARRLTDSNWIKNITKLPTDQLLMELLQLEAFKLWVDYYKFTQNERIEALLATLLSAQVSSSTKLAGQLEQANSPENKKALEDAQKNMPQMPAGVPTTTQP